MVTDHLGGSAWKIVTNEAVAQGEWGFNSGAEGKGGAVTHPVEAIAAQVHHAAGIQGEVVVAAAVQIPGGINADCVASKQQAVATGGRKGFDQGAIAPEKADLAAAARLNRFGERQDQLGRHICRWQGTTENGRCGVAAEFNSHGPVVQDHDAMVVF